MGGGGGGGGGLQRFIILPVGSFFTSSFIHQSLRIVRFHFALQHTFSRTGTSPVPLSSLSILFHVNWKCKDAKNSLFVYMMYFYSSLAFLFFNWVSGQGPWHHQFMSDKLIKYTTIKMVGWCVKVNNAFFAMNGYKAAATRVNFFSRWWCDFFKFCRVASAQWKLQV